MSVLEGSSLYSVERCRQSTCQPARPPRPASAPSGRRWQAPGREASLAQHDDSVSRMERLWAAGTELENILPPLSMNCDAPGHVGQKRSSRRPSSAAADGRRTSSAVSVGRSAAHQARRLRPTSAAPYGCRSASEARRRSPSSARGNLFPKSKEEGEECLVPPRQDISKRLCSGQEKGQHRPPGEPRRSSRACTETLHVAKQRGDDDEVSSSRSRRQEVEDLRKTRTQSSCGQPWKVTGACASTLRPPSLSRPRGSTTSGIFSDVQCLSACESEISFMESRGRTWRPWSASTSRTRSLSCRRSATTTETSSPSTQNLSQELPEVDRRLPHEFLDSDSDEEVPKQQFLGDALTGIPLCALMGGA
mmetsp:Transcript_42478/g.75288  ORF Transcript_42478/g.75288 Transcript_42478/m.75288 type:complete len:363 (-) Transcript_42478:29-1117(-)